MTEGDTYLTLTAPAEGAYREKGSRFLAFAAPVRTEGEV
jgi:putative IMPACT (imprinted ancient) family translation regulator